MVDMALLEYYWKTAGYQNKMEAARSIGLTKSAFYRMCTKARFDTDLLEAMTIKWKIPDPGAVFVKIKEGKR